MDASTSVIDKNTAMKFVYPFSSKLPAPPLDSTLLGGKGKGLAEMASIGLPVPPGFIMIFSDIVYGVSRKHFEKAFEVLKIQEGVEADTDLSIHALKEACTIFKTLFEQHANKPFPQDAYEQLHLAIMAVFNSWDSE